jgi:hypothetical protein
MAKLFQSHYSIANGKRMKMKRIDHGESQIWRVLDRRPWLQLFFLRVACFQHAHSLVDVRQSNR